MLETSHTTPEEAVKIFNDLGGKIFIPMHYGTFDLSDEPLGEPIKRLENCFKNKKELKKLKVGEKFYSKTLDRLKRNKDINRFEF